MFANATMISGRSSCEIVSQGLCVGLLVSEGGRYWIANTMGRRVSPKTSRDAAIGMAKSLSPQCTADMIG